MDKGWYARLFVVIAATVGAALFIWPSLDSWVEVPPAVRRFVKGRISPGLDIKGGLRLVYEVEVDEAIADRRDTVADDMTEQMGRKLGLFKADEVPSREQLDALNKRVRWEPVAQNDRRFRLVFAQAADAAKLSRDVVRSYNDLAEVDRSDTQVTLELKEEPLEALRETAVQQAVQTISSRIDELAIRETSVSARGTDIVIEIPGADQATFDRMREIVGRTARLEFKILDDEATFLSQAASDLPQGVELQTEGASAGPNKAQVTSYYLLAKGPDARSTLAGAVSGLVSRGIVPPGRELLLGRVEDEQTTKTPSWRTYTVFARADVSGEYIDDAWVASDPQDNRPYVSIKFNAAGARVFERVTEQNVKRRMAIVLDDRVETAPVIQTKIGGGRAQITLGGFQGYNEILNDAKDLVVVLRAGALPAPIRPSNEQMIGPSLGRDAVISGTKGAAVGVVLVLVALPLYYSVAGLIAGFMVLINLLILLGVLAAVEATLTLPGIAGIALTVGMAVDANVLINERIREELRAGKSPRAAVDQGFARAFWSIFDSQLTTLIGGIVLFQYGTGPIKGFAVTLIFGILTSLFTGIFCSRVFFEWVVRGLRVQKLRIG